MFEITLSDFARDSRNVLEQVELNKEELLIERKFLVKCVPHQLPQKAANDELYDRFDRQNS